MGAVQSAANGPGPTAGATSAAKNEGASGSAGAGSAPPPSGGSPSATIGALTPATSPGPDDVPAQIVADTISGSPFNSERLALAGAPSRGQPPGSGGTPVHVVVAKVPAAGSLTLGCLTSSRTVRCQLLLPRTGPGRLGLAYAGSANVPPAGQALAAKADGDHITPPPAGGAGLPGSGELVGGSSSAASAASGAASAAALMLAATLLLGSPLILRRLLDLCERWISSPLDLVLERPD